MQSKFMLHWEKTVTGSHNTSLHFKIYETAYLDDIYSCLPKTKRENKEENKSIHIITIIKK